MQTLNDFNNHGGASGWDGWNNYIGDREHDDWLVAPVGRNRDSQPLQESNFETALEQLGGESNTVQVHRFGHWACGWFDLILIDPADTTAVQTATDIEQALQDYPVLDEFDLSEREHAAAMEAWESYAVSDFRKAILQALLHRLYEYDGDLLPHQWADIEDRLAAALDAVPDDKLYEVYQNNDGWYETHSDGTYFTDMADVAESLDFDDVVPDYIAELKSDALHVARMAGDIFTESVRWFWDERVEFNPLTAIRQ